MEWELSTGDFLSSLNNINKVTEGLKAFNYQIAPWTSNDFWFNIRNIEFSEIYFREITNGFNACYAQLVDKKTTPEKIKSLKKMMNSYLLTIAHLLVSYGREFQEQSWSSIFEQTESTEDTILYSVYLAIIKPALQMKPMSLQEIIPNIVCFYNIPLAAYSIPLFYFSALHRFINHDVYGAFFTVYTCLQLSFDNQPSHEAKLLLFHLLKYVMSTFPGLDTSKLPNAVTQFQEYLGCQYPISTLSVELTKKIEDEIAYPGAAYFNTLNWVIDMVQEINYIPLVFDQGDKFFINTMYSELPSTSLQSSIISFVKYFVKAYFKSSKILTSEQCIEFYTQLQLKSTVLAKLKEKYGLTQDITPDPSKRSMTLYPPFVPIKPIKLQVTFEPSGNYVTKTSESYHYYASPVGAVFELSVLKPLDDILKNRLPDTFYCKICLCGDDYFLSSFLNAYCSCIRPGSQLLNILDFVIYLVPIDIAENTRIHNNGIISKFISSFDPVYKRFVSHLFRITHSILPKMDEDSQLKIPLIESNDDQFDSHLYFTDPSPNNLFQFGLQHYLINARNIVDVNVWKCELELTDPDPHYIMIVPFITTIFIGSTNVITNDFEKNATGKTRNINITYKSPNGKEEKKTNLKTTSISIANIDLNCGVTSMDEYLLLQLTKNNTVDMETLNNVHQALVTSVELEMAKGETFKAMIDMHTYQNIKKIRIARMENPHRKNENMKLHFASFVPYHEV
ncbi:hypothetical protein GPJ56_008654 [Histomonas meleagridis]|uniref:uncharacterized protein n=1 Tax=Histomonas meleagridis TaxID=135588 RepID=UPI00355A557A|nr:hypothetical protein GPJ56_008654 [Histomonas meleagridis]KAH0805770.1 hypothetical protein GO595_001409 [Histomonas meleagridis]